MKKIILCISFFAACLYVKAQYSSDTLDFSPFDSGTPITDQYASEGIIFEGYAASGDPVTYDYGAGSFGKVLHSDDWYHPIKMTFTDTLDASVYHLIDKLEFDNPINSEVDYITVDAYDSLDVLVGHYLSTSPEHVTLDYTGAHVAYVILDDSAYTAYVIDNVVAHFIKQHENDTTVTDTTTTDTTIIDTTIVDTADIIAVQFRSDLRIFPNPSDGEIHIKCDAIMDAAEITNEAGQLIYALRPDQKEITVHFPNAGVYFVTITAQGQMITKTIVIDQGKR